jgi:hypothetical protein
MFLATSGGAGTQYHPMAPSRLRPRLLVASAGRPSAAPPSYMHIACSQQFQYFIKHAIDALQEWDYMPRVGNPRRSLLWPSA